MTKIYFFTLLLGITLGLKTVTQLVAKERAIWQHQATLGQDGGFLTDNDLQ